LEADVPWLTATVPIWVTSATTQTATNYLTWVVTPTATTAATASVWYQAQPQLSWYGDQMAFEARIARRAERNAVYREQVYAPAVHRAEARHLIDDAAKARARELLLDSLTPEQRTMFELLGHFIVFGGRTNRKYRVRGNRESVVANIDAMDGEYVTHRLCGHVSPGQVPFADQLLAQKLMLEFAEEDFLRIANRHSP
jgi:hypothetical protein